MELSEGAMVRALDGCHVAPQVLELLAGALEADDGVGPAAVEVEGFGFDGAAALDSPEVLSHFFDERQFGGVRRVIGFNQVGAERFVCFAVFGNYYDLLAGESVTGAVVLGGLFARIGLGTGGSPGVRAIRFDFGSRGHC
jgi:hypothetical protein